jgi:predicted MFS family arabinose efflux permease
MIFNYYYLLVTLPIYLIQDLQGPKSQAGLIVTVFFIAAIIIRPFAGQWIVSYGIKKVFLITLIIYFVSTLLYFFAESMASLLVLRVLHGIGFGMITTTTGSIAANLAPEARKGEGMGYFGLMINMAMAAGPFLGLTVMYAWGAEAMFAISSASVALGTLTGLLISLPKKDKTKATDNVLEKKGLDLDALFEISALRISVVGLFFALVYASIISFISVYADEIQMTDAASYFFVVYAIVLILSRPFTGKWFDRYGANVIMYPAILCLAVGMLVLSQANSAFIFLLSAALIGLGWGTIFPSCQTIAIQLSTPERRSVATATFLSTLDIGIGIGSSILGFVGAGLGYSTLYVYCSIFTLSGFAVYYFLHGKTGGGRRNFSVRMD